MDTPRPIACDEVEKMLTPWADGEAPGADRLGLEAHLARCAACRAQAGAELGARTVLRARRAALAVAAPADLAERCRPQPRRSAGARRWVPLSLAATLLLAVGGAFLYGLGNRVHALAATITADHLKCFRVTDTGARADAAAEAARWEQRFGWRVAVMPDVPLEEIRFVGVRRCLSTRGQVAHLMYTCQGRPLSVFVWREPAYDRREIESLGHQTLLWSSRDRMYAVVGREPRERMARVAAYLRQIEQ